MDSLSPSELASRLERELSRTGLKPGWRLPSEERLATIYGVSRGAIRRAIAVLRERGVLTSRRGGGTFMNAPGTSGVAEALRGYARQTEADKSVEELLDLRVLVESECARALAAQRRKGAVNRLEDAFALMRRDRDDAAAFAVSDFAFHRTLVRESGNALFHAIMEALHGIFEEYAKHGRTASADRRTRVLAEHEAILDAVREGDAAAAAHLTAAHIRRAKTHLLSSRKPA